MAAISRPAIALEMMLFSSIAQEGIDLTDGKSANKLAKLCADLKGRFPECEFDLHMRQR